MNYVAVSQRIDFYPKRNEIRDALDQRIIQFLLKAGYLPVPVPNNLLEKKSKVKNSSTNLSEWIKNHPFKAVLLSGGNDIGVFKQRDLTENYLIEYARKNKLPLLGICRGMQMMGVCAGIKLKKIKGHVNTFHKLSGSINRVVNSYHKYSLAKCPVDYKVIASSEDNEIEAIRHNDLCWEGWMWHPERKNKFDLKDMKRIKDLFEN